MGDRNTRFFHTSTIVRRARNRINSLLDSEENLVSDESNLKQLIRDFYVQLYCEALAISTACPSLPSLFPPIERPDWERF